MSKCYYRYFTNNDKYGERKTPYLDSLAFIIQEFLYSKDKAKQEIIYKERVFDNYTMTTHTNKKTKSFDCEMDGRIQLYDFVTMTLHLINTLPSDFAKVQLKECLADLKQKSGVYSRDDISYTSNNGIYLYNTSKEMIFALLWAAWIYMKVFLDLNPNKMLEKCVEMLYDAMKENYPYTEENLEKHPLIAHAPDAMTLMCQHIQAKAKKSKSNKSSDKEHAEDNSELQARIKELESELEKAKKQVADLEKQNKEQKDSIELLSSDIPEIDAQQKVRMELARKIMSEAGMNAAFMDLRGRKTKVATLMGTLLEIPTHTCASWLSNRELNRETHQKSIKEINDIFEALGLAIRV